MPKERVMISFTEEELEKLDEEAKKHNVSRNVFVVQIVRKHLGFPSLLKESS